MTNFIQRWLGIDVILAHLHDIRDNRLEDNRRLNSELATIKSQVGASNSGMGRLIAKLDPHYAKDEQDPTRKAESDKIGDDVIKKLTSEHIIRNRVGGPG